VSSNIQHYKSSAISQASKLATLASFSPALHVTATLLYAAALHFSYLNYLFPVWGYYGFTLHEPDFEEYAFALALLLPVSFIFPRYIANPSVVILSILHCIVFVPTIIITLCLSPVSIEHYWAVLVSLSTGFFLAIVIVRTRASDLETVGGLLSDKTSNVLVLVWISLFALLAASNWSNLRFASLEETYVQREASGNVASSLLSYSNSLLGTFFSPALLSIGLMKSKYIYIAMGIIGCMLIYMINASRTMFLLPLAIFLLFLAIRKGKSLQSSTFMVPLFFATSVFLVVLNQSFSDVGGGTLPTYFVFRTIGLPGLSFSQYYDVFSVNGFTYWSHIKGISFFVPPPAAFADDQLWPGLGYIIGDRVYGSPKLDANANLFSGDGAAAAGSFGVLVISIVFGLWLRLLDSLSVKWNRNLAMLAAAPIAIQLTNGHFFTMLLSFGGLLLMILLYFAVPELPGGHRSYQNQRRKRW
jgi:hypothetical protein